ncbi:MAG: hypothetical protein DMF51_01925 [Acidobacteria bacterium]|nr:MAG: hypothetical protein DMF51_01925 [Acidobacteriota bacterium]
MACHTTRPVTARANPGMTRRRKDHEKVMTSRIWLWISLPTPMTDRATQLSHPDLVSVVRLRRNFGQTAALAAGFDQARGRVIVTMDGDLQNDPADIPRLLEELSRGHDVVSGWRRIRRDPFFSRRLPSLAGNWLIGVVTGVALHDYGCTLKAYRREVLEQMTLYGEMHRFLPAQAHWVGARIAEIPVKHRPQRAEDASQRPKGVQRFGAVHPEGVSFIQSPLLLLSALFVILGGQCFLLGLLAEIAVRTYYESQQKRIYIIKEMHRAGEPGGSGRHGRWSSRD